MKAYIFPGQGSQFTGMGKDLYDNYSLANELFKKADNVLGFSISEIMFTGTAEDLKQTKVTQPAIFIHSLILSRVMGKNFTPQAVAGHSLGELSALASIGVVNFEEGLKLVYVRAMAMQEACNVEAGTMAAILGLEENIVEDVCKEESGIVVAANYNCPGQLVISGKKEAVEKAVETLKEKGARRALLLPVGGAFHSPLMEPAKKEFAKAVERTEFKKPLCPIYQNVCATGVTDVNEIKSNLIKQLISPVRWTQSVENMVADGYNTFTEVGPGRVLQGLVKKIAPNAVIEAVEV